MSTSIVEAPDLVPFSWIEDGLRSPFGAPPEGDHALRTLDMVPPRFPAYAKILHPIFEDPDAGEGSWDQTDKVRRALEGASWLDDVLAASRLVRVGVDGGSQGALRRIRWSDVASELGLAYGPALSTNDLDRAWPGGSWPARLLGPEEGDLGAGILSVIVEAIRVDGDPGPCFFWWWVVACIHEFDPEAPRDLLFHGRLHDLPGFLGQREVTSPTCWWPATHAWCVSTDWDLPFTVMGGSESLIARVLDSSEVEGFSVAPEDAILRYGKVECDP